MKGHKEHHHRSTGGVNQAEEDLNDKPEARTNAKKIDAEAEERRHGGGVKRMKRKHGGEVHHSRCKCEKCTGGAVERKEGGKVEGEHAKHHAGRMPRKSGGRTYSTENPFSSARPGAHPKGHQVEEGME
jgi:hypothetical protein